MTFRCPWHVYAKVRRIVLNDLYENLQTCAASRKFKVLVRAATIAGGMTGDLEGANSLVTEVVMETRIGLPHQKIVTTDAELKETRKVNNVPRSLRCFILIAVKFSSSWTVSALFQISACCQKLLAIAATSSYGGILMQRLANAHNSFTLVVGRIRTTSIRMICVSANAMA